MEDGKYTTKGISNDVFQYIKEVKSYEASSEGTVQASKSSITRRISPNDLGDKVTLLHEQKLENEIKDVPHSLPGFLNHHIWEHVCGYRVESLREFILFPQAPSKRRTLSMSSAQRSDEHNNFGEQIFGLISPNVTGKYQFAISSSGNSELWLSSDETSENLRKIAFVTSDNHLGRSQPGNFSNTPSQISSACFLTKNNRYLISILHKHNVGRAHLDVAWRLFGREVKFNVISSLFLWAVVNDSHVTDNTVQISDYQEQLQRSHVMHPPFVDSEQIKDVLTSCHYEPSYLVKHKLIRFQGARNKSNTHFAAVYPADSTNNTLPLLENEDIWWWENAIGNARTDPNLAKEVVLIYMGALEEKFPRRFKLQEIVSVEHVPDPRKGDRFLLELLLTDSRTGGRNILLSEHVFRSSKDKKLYYPEGFYWKKQVTVNIVVPVKNGGRWALYFIKNIAEITRQTKDLNVRVIIIDYESTDINIEAVLNKSSLRQFTVVRIPREEGFKRAVALQLGAEAVKDPHSVLFLCDLHLKIPSNLIPTIRKHCIEGKMAFAPVVKRLKCGYYPDLPFGYWETLGFGLLAIYKSDFDRVGGMNVREFTKWGGEDWELLDRILMSGLEVERLKIPDFYHFFHPSFEGSNQRVGA
ncbi:beta-1,4-N-acetylgalactosaminyltransferase 3-like [Porites lutea]|uniref:beta-1,4-N-acetylgalactosaminyltransferase 3-like n=1 Tax=Porites lutea TaxID=51062 RepID=UPI003CC55578